MNSDPNYLGCDLSPTVWCQQLRNQIEPTVGLYVLYGSWNEPLLHPRKEPIFLKHVLKQFLNAKLPATTGTATTTTTTSSSSPPSVPYYYFYGGVKVDPNQDDCISWLCGDNDNNNNHINHLNNHPCPPEQLPALAVTKNHSIHYLTSLTSKEILSLWMNPQDVYSSNLSSAVCFELSNLTLRRSTSFSNLTIRPLLSDPTMNMDTDPPDQGGFAAAAAASSSLPRQEFPTTTTTTTTTTYPATTTKATTTTTTTTTTNNDTNRSALRIFVAGDRMSVGKSSVCLGLLGVLHEYLGYASTDLAYIKPATQNEAPQLVQIYCEQKGIEHVPIGPIVYYRGFTRAFLAQETESTETLLGYVSRDVDQIARGKRVVIIDGVGFPAVGSICGTDNASVARASGYPSGSSSGNNGTLMSLSSSSSSSLSSRQPPAVLLVGGSGVGGAVDAFNLNATYFEQAHVPVIGAIFNKLELEGFYSLDNCKTQITSYFDQSIHQRQLNRRPFGFVPVMKNLTAGSDKDNNNNKNDPIQEFVRLFHHHVNVRGILDAATQVQQQEVQGQVHVKGQPTSILVGSTTKHLLDRTVISNPTPKRQKINADTSSWTTNRNSSSRSRHEIERAAIQQGAPVSA